MAVRFDYASIKNAHLTEDGRLFCDAFYAVDGVLEYRQRDGTTVRELRRPEENQRMAENCAGLYVTLEHPPFLLTSESAKAYTVGMTDDSPSYDGGFVKGGVKLFDQIAIDSVLKGDRTQGSLGYRCDIKKEPGIWNGQPYDQEQINVSPNHYAITRRGRAGPEVGLKGLHFDSADDPDFALQISADQEAVVERTDEKNGNCGCQHKDGGSMAETATKKRKMQIPLKGGALQEIEMDADDADMLQRYMDMAAEEKKKSKKAEEESDRKDSLISERDELIQELQERVDALEADKEELAGRYQFDSDAWESEREQLTSRLDSESESWDEERTALEARAAALEAQADNRMDADEIESLVEERIKERYDAWEEAKPYLPGDQRDRFDATVTPVEYQMMVLQSLAPNLRLDGKTDDAIALSYETVLADQPSRQDSTKSLRQAIAATAQTVSRTDAVNAREKMLQETENLGRKRIRDAVRGE